MKTALIIGASGLIGTDCTNLLLVEDSIEEVILLVRKELPINHPKLKQVIIDFNNIEAYKEKIKADVILCCIGSTMKKAGTKSNYELIDRTYPLSIAKIALKNGASHFLLVSAMGANINSSIFYSRLKGLIENDIKQLGYTTVSIFRPSLLVGNRKEHRFGEVFAIKLIKLVNPLLIGPLKKYRSISTINVAKAMRYCIFNDANGIYIYESDKIQKLSAIS